MRGLLTMRHQFKLARRRTTRQFHTGATEASSLKLREGGDQAIDVKIDKRRSK